MNSDSPIISLDGVCFGYEQREILHDLHLQIPRGSFTVIVGPNGSGKTTLLHLLTGLVEPRHGTVTVLGGRPADVRRRIGYVPQSLNFDTAFPASVMDIVLMGRVDSHLFGPFRRQDKQIALDCLRRTGLEGFADRPFACLSGGERQRVLMAQALASQPELLLLDEPGANLDVTSSQTIYSLLKELNHSLTIILVSHNLNTVESFATHVICINHSADIHPISEVSTTAFANGDWLRLFHDSCPVAHGGAYSSPHDQEDCHEHHH